jgi:hypothetical protein
MKNVVGSKIVLLSTLSLLSLSMTAFSEISVPKEEWLKSFRTLAPTAMCQGIMNGEKTAALLKANNITMEKCKPLITQSLDRCLAKYSPEIPQTVGSNDGKSLGEKLGRCSGEDFYTHFITKTS